jgi:hypothetical protein
MPVEDILITNILPTGTAFGVLATTHSESVFIPARVTRDADIGLGDCVRALIVPNQTHRDRTPWVVVKFEGHMTPGARLDNLPAKVLQELENGPATAREVARFLEEQFDDVDAVLRTLADNGGVVHTRLYALRMEDLLAEDM